MINNKYQIGVSVDSINYLEKDIFLLRLIPDFKSTYFTPFHTRQVRVLAELLDQSYLEWIKANHLLTEFNYNIENPLGLIVQGNYYIVDKDNFKRLKAQYEPLSKENNIFTKNISPYNGASNIITDRILSVNEINLLNIESTLDNNRNNTYLYGFYIGHGDTLLLITSAKNAYIIDTNLNKQNIDNITNEIKNILREHGMDSQKIKGLIITHLHLDHIRGASQLINNNYFTFENLIINKKCNHKNPIVNNLTIAARKIQCSINLCNPCSIKEGNTFIKFINPDNITSSAPDINDRSITMHIIHGENNIYLTGDACTSILMNAFNTSNKIISTENLLKVSHHGSRTGTDNNLIYKLKPKEAFISVGSKYQLPHHECTNALKINGVHKLLSNQIKKTVEYKCDGKNIYYSIR